MLKKRLMSACCAVLFCILPVSAERFLFKYAEGDSYRILSTVSEDVYINGLFHHHAEIINRISVDVTAVEDSKGVHDVTFMTSEESQSPDGRRIFTWGEEYRSVFKRDSAGVYEIAKEYFMPVVRNVPTFPERDLKIGDSWTGRGEEAHDLRRGFNITEPFRVTFLVTYTYEGTETVNGVLLHKISARYNMSFRNANRPREFSEDYPVKTAGYSVQTIYWNNERGAIEFYNEQFRIILETARGNKLEFTGSAKAEITETIRRNTTENIAEIERRLEELAVADTEVRSDEKGITISLENIQFMADSAVLEESEKIKLQKIAGILKQFTGNDLLVGGHTALAGSADGRLQLSSERAQAVTSYLIELGVKDAQHVFSQGFGAEKPIASNSDEAGMARNRRVEITILDR